MNNVWGTAKEGLESAVLEAVERPQPQHGGIMVEQVVTTAGNVLRARDGWELELCADGVRIRLHVGLGAFEYAGHEHATLAEIEAVEAAEHAAELARRESLAAEFDAVFAEIEEYLDAPHVDVTPGVLHCTSCGHGIGPRERLCIEHGQVISCRSCWRLRSEACDAAAE